MDHYPALAALGLEAPDGVDVAYEELLAEVLTHGVRKGDRTGTGTRSVFARQLRYDLSVGFPRITTKFVDMKAVKGELLWFLQGATNVHWLQERGITIWDEWADADGELGPVYGSQWRSWPTRSGEAIDQVKDLISTLRKDPDSRRMIVSAWNVEDLNAMALAPCHAFFQCYAAQGRLSLQVYQRSADLFLGAPFNIASYALLTHMLAQQADLEVGELMECMELMNRSETDGMQTFDQDLFKLYTDGRITMEEALRQAESVNDLRLRIELWDKGNDKEAIYDRVSNLSLQK